MHTPRAQVKIISICLDFIIIALFSLIVFQFLRDFKLNKGLYRSIDAWSFRIEDKTFLRCCVVNFQNDGNARPVTLTVNHEKTYRH